MTNEELISELERALRSFRRNSDVEVMAKSFTDGALMAFKERLDDLETWANKTVEAQARKLDELEKRITEVDLSHDRTIDRSCERLDRLEQLIDVQGKFIDAYRDRLDKLEEQAKKSAELEQGTKVLVARMRSLEGRITVLVEMFDRLEDRIGSLEQLREGT
jgi:septation ring formation regulator EzrA